MCTFACWGYGCVTIVKIVKWFCNAVGLAIALRLLTAFARRYPPAFLAIVCVLIGGSAAIMPLGAHGYCAALQSSDASKLIVATVCNWELKALLGLDTCSANRARVAQDSLSLPTIGHLAKRSSHSLWRLLSWAQNSSADVATGDVRNLATTA